MIPLAVAWAGAKKAVSLVPREVWYVLAVVAAIWFYGHLRYNAGQADTQAKFDEYKTEIKAAITKRLAQNAQKEAQDRKVFDEIAKQYAQDIKDAKAKSDRIAADLRAGNIKLRKHWRGCAAPQAADGSSGVDEEAELRVQGAAEDVRDGAWADAWIEGLQEVIRQLQKPVEQ